MIKKLHRSNHGIPLELKLIKLIKTIFLINIWTARYLAEIVAYFALALKPAVPKQVKIYNLIWKSRPNFTLRCLAQ